MRTYPTDICPHFGECGGCTCQRTPYADQLAAKQRRLQELFADVWTAPIPVEPSPTVWHYRNKGELKFDRMQYPEPPPPGTDRPTVLGYKRLGQWYWTLDLEECRILSAALPELLAAIRAWYRAHDYRYFDSRGGTGLLKHLVIRDSKRTAERLVFLSTAHANFDTASFVAAVTAACPVASVWLGIDPGTADAVRPTELHHLYGAERVEERLEIPDGAGTRTVRLAVGPMGFLQVNPAATETLYGLIRAWLRDRPAPLLYDLYGGSGGIAFTVADLVDRVLSIDNCAPATEDGIRNAALNGVTNVDFLTRRIEGWLGDMLRTGAWDPEAAVVVDPARGGLQDKALRRFLDVGPRDFLYVSCKQTSLHRELPAILRDYRLTRLHAVDLFPHTDHVELLAWFERR